jgi:cell division protein FtsZ
MEVVEPVEVIDEDQFTLTFDMPFMAGQDKEEEAQTMRFDLTDDIKAMDVVDHEELKPVTEEVGEETRYSLDDYMEIESALNAATSSEQIAEVELDEEVIFEKKIVQPVEENANANDEIDPFNSSISDLMKDRAEERKRTMKDFNYKFKTNTAKLEDIEKVPAYKRMGVDLDANMPSSEDDKNNSRMSLGTDENDDIQLRSNNSFLHDNVD